MLSYNQKQGTAPSQSKGHTMVNAIVSQEIADNIVALSELPIIGSMAAQMAVDIARVPDDFNFETSEFMNAANAQYRIQKPEHKLVEPLTIGAVAAAVAIRFAPMRAFENEFHVYATATDEEKGAQA